MSAHVLYSTMLAGVFVLGGCAVGPKYHRPDVVVPAAFKEAGDWKPVTPSDAIDRGAWWETFGDAQLNALEQQAATANTSIAQAAANYEQARQLARADRATLLPTLSATAAGQRSSSGGGRIPSSVNGGGTTAAASSGTINNNFSATLGASWTLDFWGRIQRQVEADVAAAQASAADLANARLSIQAAVAQTYWQLRIADERVRLRQLAVDDFSRTLEIAQNKYKVGIVARSDVSSARAELDAARAQLIDAGIQRAQLEHALAVLVGKTPAEFSLAVQPLQVALPAVPPQLPSSLLERRPDIATAERGIAAANARVGVQTAAYFPQISLSGDVGYNASKLGELFRTPNRVWAVGANLGETLFDFGRRSAEVAAARAAYDGSVAGYRGTVLRAFQEVEDDLVSLRLLAEEAQVQDNAVSEATEAARIAMNAYRAGTVDYTTVVTTQVAELNNRQTQLTVLGNRLNSIVALIEALGGGWRATELPAARDVLAHAAAGGR